MGEYDVRKLKNGGMMKQKEKDLFSLRLRVVGGFVDAGQLAKISDIAAKYGHGHVHLTTRQGVEIPNVNFNDIEKVRDELAKAGLEIGSCGRRLRTVTACQGAECHHGLIDSLALAREIDKEYFGLGEYPHKFKIGVTGCPNACIKPYENDLGIMGKMKKEFIAENCTYCGLCEQVCPKKAIKVDDKKMDVIFVADDCLGCGECVAVCPTSAWEKRRECYAVYVGGKMGKFPRLGTKAFDFIESREKVMEIIGKTLEFYRKHGKEGERFGDTLDRVGIKKYKDEVDGTANG